MPKRQKISNNSPLCQPPEKDDFLGNYLFDRAVGLEGPIKLLKQVTVYSLFFCQELFVKVEESYGAKLPEGLPLWVKNAFFNFLISLGNHQENFMQFDIPKGVIRSIFYGLLEISLPAFRKIIDHHIKHYAEYSLLEPNAMDYAAVLAGIGQDEQYQSFKKTAYESVTTIAEQEKPNGSFGVNLFCTPDAKIMEHTERQQLFRIFFPSIPNNIKLKNILTRHPQTLWAVSGQLGKSVINLAVEQLCLDETILAKLKPTGYPSEDELERYNHLFIQQEISKCLTNFFQLQDGQKSPGHLTLCIKIINILFSDYFPTAKQMQAYTNKQARGFEETTNLSFQDKIRSRLLPNSHQKKFIDDVVTRCFQFLPSEMGLKNYHTERNQRDLSECKDLDLGVYFMLRHLSLSIDKLERLSYLITHIEAPHFGLDRAEALRACLKYQLTLVIEPSFLSETIISNSHKYKSMNLLAQTFLKALLPYLEEAFLQGFPSLQDQLQPLIKQMQDCIQNLIFDVKRNNGKCHTKETIFTLQKSYKCAKAECLRILKEAASRSQEADSRKLQALITILTRPLMVINDDTTRGLSRVTSKSFQLLYVMGAVMVKTPAEDEFLTRGAEYYPNRSLDFTAPKNSAIEQGKAIITTWVSYPLNFKTLDLPNPNNVGQPQEPRLEQFDTWADAQRSVAIMWAYKFDSSAILASGSWPTNKNFVKVSDTGLMRALGQDGALSDPGNSKIIVGSLQLPEYLQRHKRMLSSSNSLVSQVESPKYIWPYTSQLVVIFIQLFRQRFHVEIDSTLVKHIISLIKREIETSKSEQRAREGANWLDREITSVSSLPTGPFYGQDKWHDKTGTLKASHLAKIIQLPPPYGKLSISHLDSELQASEYMYYVPTIPSALLLSERGLEVIQRLCDVRKSEVITLRNIIFTPLELARLHGLIGSIQRGELPLYDYLDHSIIPHDHKFLDRYLSVYSKNVSTKWQTGHSKLLKLIGDFLQASGRAVADHNGRIDTVTLRSAIILSKAKLISIYNAANYMDATIRKEIEEHPEIPTAARSGAAAQHPFLKKILDTKKLSAFYDGGATSQSNRTILCKTPKEVLTSKLYGDAQP